MASAKECVTTHLPMPVVPKMSGARSSVPIPGRQRYRTGDVVARAAPRSPVKRAEERASGGNAPRVNPDE